MHRKPYLFNYSGERMFWKPSTISLPSKFNFIQPKLTKWRNFWTYSWTKNSGQINFFLFSTIHNSEVETISKNYNYTLKRSTQLTKYSLFSLSLSASINFQSLNKQELNFHFILKLYSCQFNFHEVFNEFWWIHN